MFHPGNEKEGRCVSMNIRVHTLLVDNAVCGQLCSNKYFKTSCINTNILLENCSTIAIILTKYFANNISRGSHQKDIIISLDWNRLQREREKRDLVPLAISGESVKGKENEATHLEEREGELSIWSSA